ncbi:Cytochrome c assembly protein [Candidatus Nitrosacidococcus tergens]|uniref:Cytochrome c assembly protein n=2 Tax=Candidatus Nitrosacidococcus tergens TaxID=553981 RepID=A0A7G1Q8E8_9GAMM|nr:Cytochrome c assembly protein [Candidatus Nitrosacidococcus tergens]
MQFIFFETISGVICYCTASMLLVRYLLSTNTKNPKNSHKQLVSICGFIGIVFHTLILRDFLFTPAGINLSLTNALSTVAWLMAVLLIIASLRQPVENMGIGIYPFAAVALGLQNLFPENHIIIPYSAELSITEKPLEIHILLSFFAYSLCALATMQAILLAVQDNYLRNKRLRGFIRVLPPLQTMESILFQLLTLGFILLSLSLFSGIIPLENMFAQHLAHKTVFSIIAWLIFGNLLWGRWRFGWRGQIAIRWTLSGFFFLMLAYFGSKLVLELIFHRV